MSFSIQFLDMRTRLAVIQVGAFREKFTVSGTSKPSALFDRWLRTLGDVRKRKSSVLPTWLKGEITARGWVLYREYEQIYVQDMLFPKGLTTSSGRIPRRETTTEDGFPISEWTTTVSEIETFLKGCFFDRRYYNAWHRK